MIGIVKALRSAGVPVCVTCNPGYAGRSTTDAFKNEVASVAQKFTIPPYEDIVRCMLASNGILECDELGQAVVSFFSACKEKLPKQYHYDFGMRNYKANVNAVGQVLRQSNEWNSARAVAARTFAKVQLAKTPEEDRALVFDLLKQHLTEAPAEQNSLVDNLEF